MSTSQEPLLSTEGAVEDNDGCTGWLQRQWKPILCLCVLAGGVAVAAVALKPRSAPGRIEPMYSEEEARAMIHFCAASYDPKPEHCLPFAPQSPSYDLSHYKVLSNDIVDCPAGLLNDQVAKCAGFVACTQSSAGKCEHIVLAYRGTQHFNQARAEIADFKTMTDFKGAKVSEYQLNIFKLLHASFATTVQAARNCSGCRITVTGHSLGGAVASIAAAALADELQRGLLLDKAPQVSLYTFGQPRTGNCAWAKLHDKLVPNSHRVVHGLDLIPHLPLCTGNPDCVCDENPASISFYHHGTEVWYKDTMPDGPPMICRGQPANEDKACSNANFAHSWSQYWNIFSGMSDHFHYFGIFVGKYCLPGHHPQQNPW